MHGVDDVSLAGGVKPLAIVNHYLTIGGTGLAMTAEDVGPEHVIGFLADSDWPFSGRAQARCLALAGRLAGRRGVGREYMWLYLGSRFGFEHVEAQIVTLGEDQAAERFDALL